MKVPYRYERGRILRPMIDVDILANSRQVISADALVDSGADACLFDMSYARLAGVKIYPQLAERIDGVAGGLEVFPAVMDVRVLGHRFQLRVRFAVHVDPNILGRDNFFRVFHVCFDERNHELELRYRRKPRG